MIIFYVQELSKEVAGASGKVIAKKCDVSKEEDILALYSSIRAEYGGADVCINNAGLACDASILSGATEDWREIMEVTNSYTCTLIISCTTLQVNFLAACIMTREFMKQLKERNCDNGHIIMMGRLVEFYSRSRNSQVRSHNIANILVFN